MAKIDRLRGFDFLVMVSALSIPASDAVAKLINIETIASYFESLDDPRHTRNRLHLLFDVIVISVEATKWGCGGPTAMHRWAVNRKKWLEQHLELSKGIPSRDCIRRILIAIQPEAFQRCIHVWSESVRAKTSDNVVAPTKRLVAIDSKTCRGSHDESKSLGPLHLVSAWASEEGLALGQVAADDKSNEITAIP